MGSGESWLENVDTFRLSLTTMWGSREKKYLSKNSEITQYLLLTFHKFFGGSVYWTNQKWIMSKNSYLKNSYLLPKSGTNKYEFFKYEFFDIGHFWLVQYTDPAKNLWKVRSRYWVISEFLERDFFSRDKSTLFLGDANRVFFWKWEVNVLHLVAQEKALLGVCCCCCGICIRRRALVLRWCVCVLSK